jgi:hypothetical protein
MAKTRRRRRASKRPAAALKNSQSGLIWLPEPRLLFGSDQAVEDPRDGLTLFGPLDKGRPYGIRAGVIGTATGIALFKRWLQWLQGPVESIKASIARPPFPGFEAAFRIPWDPTPALALEIPPEELASHMYLDDRHQRIFETVKVYTDRIEKALQSEETKPDVWFIVIPPDVWKYGRPKSTVAPAMRQEALKHFTSVRQAKEHLTAPSLFEERNEAAQAYAYQEHFRNQLKARLLKHKVATQVLREPTLQNILKPSDEGFKPATAIVQPAIAWHLSTAAFYKSGGRPWKVAGVREGVCYVGLVFKQEDRGGDPRNACCAAQMFLASGDGVVFKGAVGPWYSPDTGDFHVTTAAAHDLVLKAIKAYKDANNQTPPRELFLHGRVKFNWEEWRGFEQAAKATNTAVVGVRIRDASAIKLYRWGDNPVLRGTALVQNDHSAFLWTRGWTPRLQTYVGRGVPNPLSVDVTHGKADLRTVLQDVLALTKLNYNACVFADGVPITLKFADSVGEVLTAGPVVPDVPLPFMYYI